MTSIRAMGSLFQYPDKSSFLIGLSNSGSPQRHHNLPFKSPEWRQRQGRTLHGFYMNHIPSPSTVKPIQISHETAWSWPPAKRLFMFTEPATGPRQAALHFLQGSNYVRRRIQFCTPTPDWLYPVWPGGAWSRPATQKRSVTEMLLLVLWPDSPCDLN